MAEQVLDLERKAIPPVLDFFKNKLPDAFDKAFNFGKGGKKEVAAPPPVEPAPVQGVNIVLSPIEINGFYLLSGNNYVTFYVTTLNQKREYIKEGWTATGITGLSGQLAVMAEGADFNLDMGSRTAPISGNSSEPYIWSFRIQSDTEQAIAPYQAVTGAVLYPPGQIDYTAMKRQGTI